LKAFEYALKINPNDNMAFCDKGLALMHLDRDVKEQEPLEIRVTIDSGDCFFLGRDNRVKSSWIDRQSLSDFDLHSTGSLLH
jgi:hypothetical protein